MARARSIATSSSPYRQVVLAASCEPDREGQVAHLFQLPPMGNLVSTLKELINICVCPRVSDFEALSELSRGLLL
jgi:hypothetical protein